MTTVVYEVDGAGAGDQSFGDIRPPETLLNMAALPSLIAYWDTENGIQGGGASFVWRDRINNATLETGQTAAGDVVPPVLVENQVNGHSALAFGDASVGGGVVTRNGELFDPTIRDVTGPFSIAVLGRGNGTSSGTIAAVGADAQEFIITHLSNGRIAIYAGMGVLVMQSANSYTTTDLLFIIASWDGTTATLSVNGTDVVSGAPASPDLSNGVLRIGAAREGLNDQTRPLTEGRISMVSLHDVNLHDPSQVAALDTVNAYYNEYRGA